MKRCTKCQADKTLSDFCKDQKRRDGLNPWCRSCVADYQDRNPGPRQQAVRKYRRTEKGRERGYQCQISALYGLTPERYEAMVLAQGGVCAICQQPQSGDGSRGRSSRLFVDHKHVDGYAKLPAAERAAHVRGLLCARCNKALGLFKDDPRRLRVAAAYLDNPALNALSKAA